MLSERSSEDAGSSGAAPRHGVTCRFCGAHATETFVDLGTSPLANSYLRPEDLERGETYHPLHAYVCTSCWLVQLGAFVAPGEIFSDYAYFSSVSESWVRHARAYAEAAIPRLGLDRSSRVVEVASNDGYLLRWFASAGIPVLGIEPAANIARAAVDAGVPTEVAFFGTATAIRMAERHGLADLMVANNVLAHVPDLNDFVAGFRILLRPGGVATLEFPHLLRLIDQVQFDTIYHEHFSYFSLLTVERVMAAHGLRVFDVDRLPTHGGSIRIHVCHAADARPEGAELGEVRDEERSARLDDVAVYRAFGERVVRLRHDLLAFLIEARRAGRRVVGYGAPAKGNTLLNYCGVRPDLVAYTVDLSPHKQGLFLPGSRLPIMHPNRLRQEPPDDILLLAWNLREEILRQNADLTERGCRWVLPVPEVHVHL